MTDAEVRALVHPDDRAIVERRVRERFEGKPVPEEVCYRVLRKDGAVRWLEALVNEIEYDGGRVFLSTVIDVTERKRMEEVLRAVSEGVSCATGDDFFQLMVGTFADVLSVGYAMVGEIVPGRPGIARVIAVAGGDEAGVEYELAGGPCEAVVGTGTCVYERGVQALFPRDAMLRRLEAESYVGTPLCGADGEPLGVLALLDRRPLAEADLARTLLEAFAGRAAAELLRRRIELELRHRETELRLAFNQLPGSSWTTDRDLRITSARRGGHTSSFSSVGEHVGRTIYDLFPGAGSDLAPIAAHLGALEGRSSGYGIQFDGRDWEAQVEPLRDADGRIVGCIGHAMDVTERTHVETALRETLAWRDAIVEGAPDAIFISDVASRFVLVNRAASDLTGYSRDELLRMGTADLHDVAPPGSRRRHPRGLGAANAVLEGVLRRKDGRTVPVEFNNRTMSGGTIPYTLTVARDMTERLRVQAAVRDGRRRLQALSRDLMGAQERERARIARELHDQVGQELTAVKLQLLPLLEGSSEGSARLVGVIHTIESVLEKVRTLSFDLRPSALDELGLRAALWSYARRQAGLAGLTLRLRADEALPKIGKDVEAACFRVAQEAVTNVIRHAQAQCLTVRLRRVSAGVELVVQDDGIGVHDGTDDRRGAGTSGTGLGLVGMQERARLVGGTVVVERPRSRGTRIRATFPAAGRGEAAG